MKLSDVTLMYAKYKINKMTLSIPTITDPYEIKKEQIANIVIENDYENYMFPFFEIDVIVPNYIHRTMKKNNQSIHAYIDLQYGYSKETPDYSESIPTFTSYLTDTFYVFMEDMTPEASEALIEQKEKEEDTFGKGMNIGDCTSIKLLLYKEDYLFKSKTTVNAILTSVTLIDALTFVLNKAGITKVLISPPNNYKTYSEFVITPITAMEQADRICNEFGMHTNGTLIFFGLKAVYIIDKSPTCTAFVKNEYKTTYLVSCPIASQSSTLAKGCYYNTNEKYSLLNLDPDTLKISSKSVVNDQLYGNDFININAKTGSITTVSSGASTASGTLSSPTRVVITTKGDDTSGAIKQQAAESSKILSMGFSYINLNMLEPNKEFIFSIDDTRFSKYAGKYRITSSLAIFEKEGDYFIPHVTAEFKGI